jgi:hypothetical protein
MLFSSLERTLANKFITCYNNGCGKPPIGKVLPAQESECKPLFIRSFCEHVNLWNLPQDESYFTVFRSTF